MKLSRVLHISENLQTFLDPVSTLYVTGVSDLKAEYAMCLCPDACVCSSGVPFTGRKELLHWTSDKSNFNVDVFPCGGGETYDLLKTLRVFPIPVTLAPANS